MISVKVLVVLIPKNFRDNRKGVVANREQSQSLHDDKFEAVSPFSMANKPLHAALVHRQDGERDDMHAPAAALRAAGNLAEGAGVPKDSHP